MDVIAVDDALLRRIPTPGEDARRIVRTGLVDAFPWLDEARGPEPGEVTYDAYLAEGRTLLVRRSLVERLNELARR